MELAPRPQARREADLPGHRRPPLRHPPRGAAARRERAAHGVDHAPHALARSARTRASSCSCSGSARRRTTPSSSSRSARASKPPSADLSPRPSRGPRASARRAAWRCRRLPPAGRVPAAPPRRAPASARRCRTSAPSVAATPRPAPSSRRRARRARLRAQPGAIVVAIDPGHGGCLDWGVPDPSERGVELRREDDDPGHRRAAARPARGARASTVVMIARRRRGAGRRRLSGPRLPRAAVAGRRMATASAGFEPEPAGSRTRDELQARLDLANLAARRRAGQHPHQLADPGRSRLRDRRPPRPSTTTRRPGGRGQRRLAAGDPGRRGRPPSSRSRRTSARTAAPRRVSTSTHQPRRGSRRHLERPRSRDASRTRGALMPSS